MTCVCMLLLLPVHMIVFASRAASRKAGQRVLDGRSSPPPLMGGWVLWGPHKLQPRQGRQGRHARAHPAELHYILAAGRLAFPAAFFGGNGFASAESSCLMR